jgi:glycosyltransferase involved in cell wall biosynthesis
MISVVIPAYNEEKLIRACLESLLKQDYTGEYEVVVVDNGCRDRTKKIALNMGAKVIDCPSKGVSNARQAGAVSAQGEIVVQADADTVYPNWWLSRIQRQFHSHPAAIAVAGTFIYSNPPWWAVFEYFLRVFFGFLSNVVFGRPLIISGANFAFYKKALMQIGGYHQEVYSADQLDISRRLRQVGKIFYDGRSYCATSSRSVAKPTLVIIGEFIQNLNMFSKNTKDNILNNRKNRSKKANSITPGTYIKVAIPILILGFLAYCYYVPDSPVFGQACSSSTIPAKVMASTSEVGPDEHFVKEVRQKKVALIALPLITERLRSFRFECVTIPELLGISAINRL